MHGRLSGNGKGEIEAWHGHSWSERRDYISLYIYESIRKTPNNGKTQFKNISKIFRTIPYYHYGLIYFQSPYDYD